MVGGFNHFEKYEFVNGEDDIPYMKWNIYIYTYITSGTEWLPPTKESACRRDGRYTIGASVLSNPTGWKDGKGLQKNFNIIHNIVII
jgi:hypothetical protein